MSRVYIPNRGPHNYDEAQKFGRLVYCTEGSLDKFDTAQMYRILSDSMKNSDEQDYILLTSLTSLCCIACGILSAKHQQLHLLIHQGGQYVRRSLYFNTQEADGNVAVTHSKR